MTAVHGTDLAWRSLSPFGVELDHDLAAPLSAAQGACFVRLLWEHGLILARGQRLSVARQQALCALAGPILVRAGESGYLSAEQEGPSQSELSWHADAAYTDAPFDALALHAIDVVDDASATCFVNAEHALASLPSALRARLADAQVEMISPSYDAIGLRSCDRRDPVALKRGIRPAIGRNPHNGRDGIRVSELQAAQVVGLGWEDSRALLSAVYDHLYRPAHILEHRWRTGDLVVWDNIALQHMRRSLKDCGRRVLQRTIVGTAGVAPHVAAEPAGVLA